MAPSALSSLVALVSASVVAAQTLTFPATPLNQLVFASPTDLPYQIYPDSTPYVRGPQTGYNICNSTTESQTSMCQTQYFNDFTDFCLWAPPNANSTISDTEGEEVAWCSKKGHGTRIIPGGTIIGAQILKTNEYMMITGKIRQSNINIQDGDFGGELDSGGQDERGNPIGGAMYSTAFGGQLQQIEWWTEFIGSDMFCMKICNPKGSNQSGYCQHTLDRIGLLYNCPSKYTVNSGFATDGEFEVCDSDLMTVPGIYVDSTGATQSYAQPPESLGPITSIPYTPSVVASRNCVTSASAALFTDAPPAPSTSGASAASSATGSASASGSKVTAASGSRTGSAASASQTSGSSSGSSTSGANANAMTSLIFSLVAGVTGVVGSIMLFA